jgi:hypothetical protein
VPDVLGDVTVVNAIAAVIASVIIAKILIAMHILLGAHPIGWAIAVIGAIIGAIIGVDEAKNLLKGAHIPGFLRGILVSNEKLASLVTEASTNISNQIEAALTENERTAPPSEKLESCLREQIGQALRKRADDAILLLK